MTPEGHNSRTLLTRAEVDRQEVWTLIPEVVVAEQNPVVIHPLAAIPLPEDIQEGNINIQRQTKKGSECFLFLFVVFNKNIFRKNFNLKPIATIQTTTKYDRRRNLSEG